MSIDYDLWLQRGPGGPWDDDEPPDCRECDGAGGSCEHCGGTGYEPEPEPPERDDEDCGPLETWRYP